MVTPRTWLAAIAAIVVLGALVLGRAAAAPPGVIPAADRAFDHARHDASATAKGKSTVCVDCHLFDDRGVLRPGTAHARCNRCHGPGGRDLATIIDCGALSRRGPGSPARVCATCHQASGRCPLPSDLPPRFTGPSTLAASFSHPKHDGAGKPVDLACAACHEPQAPVAARPTGLHAACGGCHVKGGPTPAISECRACHNATSAPPATTTPPAPRPFQLGTFDHRRHHDLSKSAPCTTCHVEPDEAGRLRPTMAACSSSCHDGRAAFSALGTSCTRCHIGSGQSQSFRPDVTFSHAQHRGLKVDVDSCATCHTLGLAGAVGRPLEGKDHQPCASAGCHASEFQTPKTTICGVCHDSASPWIKAVSRPPTRLGGQRPEYTVDVDHAAHLTRMGGGETGCVTCHGDKLGGAPRPAVHAACAGCHGTSAKPAMIRCEGCHPVAHGDPPAANPWSVRALFTHPIHRDDPRTPGRRTTCADCHATVAAATTLAAITPPTKAQCETCHDNQHAFKTTGFGCARCHHPPEKAAK